MIHRSQPRRLNKDTDERLLKFDEMKEALNVLVKASADGDEGAVKMAEGNVPLQFIDGESLPAGTNTVIGSVTDEDALIIYFFVQNSQGQHSVCGYSSSLNRCFIVYQSSFLAFKENGFVKADIVKNRRVSSAGSLVIDPTYNEPDIIINEGGAGGDDGGSGVVDVLARKVDYSFTFDMSAEMTKRGNAIGRDYYGNTSDALQDMVDQGHFFTTIKFVTNAEDQLFYDFGQVISDDPANGSLNRVVESYYYSIIGGKPCITGTGTVYVNPDKLDDPGARLEATLNVDDAIIGNKYVVNGSDAPLELGTFSAQFADASNIDSTPVIFDSSIALGGPIKVGYEGEMKAADLFNVGQVPAEYNFTNILALNRIRTLTQDQETGISSFSTQPPASDLLLKDAFYDGRLTIDFENSEWYQAADDAVNESFPGLNNDFTGIGPGTPTGF